MFDRKWLAAAASLLIVGAAAASRGDGPLFGSGWGSAAKQEQPNEEILGSQTVKAVFAGWDGPGGSAVLRAEGGMPANAELAKGPVSHFLTAHQGLPVALDVQSVKVRRGSGTVTVQRITGARIGAVSAAQWWAGLTPQQRQAAARQTQMASAGSAPMGGSFGFSGPVRTASTSSTAAEQPRTLYVDSVSGSDDQGDGQTPQTAFKTIGRALAQVPTVVDDFWMIRLAAGTYGEGVELRRFAMQSMLSNQQLREEPIPRAIAFAGPAPGDGAAVIAPPSGRPCVSAASVVLFLDTLTCRVSGANGISSAGSTLVFDDVRIEASASANHGVYAETSVMYLGGSFAVEGPFTIGLAARVNSLARTGTRRNPATADLLFKGVTSHAIFVRDGGNFTSAFERGTVRVIDSGQAIYALLGSRVFLSAELPLQLENVSVGIASSQLSGVNVHEVLVTGAAPHTFVRCHRASYLVLEKVTAPAQRPADTDGTCSVLTY